MKEIHADPAGQPKGAIEYCTKEDTRIDGPWSYGEKPQLGGDHKSITFKDLVNKSFEEA